MLSQAHGEPCSSLTQTCCRTPSPSKGGGLGQTQPALGDSRAAGWSRYLETEDGTVQGEFYHGANGAEEVRTGRCHPRGNVRAKTRRWEPCTSWEGRGLQAVQRSQKQNKASGQWDEGCVVLQSVAQFPSRGLHTMGISGDSSGCSHRTDLGARAEAERLGTKLG